ncbi:MAG TPA: DNA gyrase C-terminal beta-propeller domain-containing protein, partial [Pirellulaceae bacterium]|nr:DNA gyrase C-terminal beta-propeller domain-containing protein [Pirellulaceae bacterium]
PEAEEVVEEDEISSSARYRTQRRGGKGLRDIKTTARNGRVVDILRVDDGDEILMMTSRGKLQRVAVSEIGVIGRNTQGVRIMNLDDDDTLAGVVRVPQETGVEIDEAEMSPRPAPPIAATDADGVAEAVDDLDGTSEDGDATDGNGSDE